MLLLSSTVATREHASKGQKPESKQRGPIRTFPRIPSSTFVLPISARLILRPSTHWELKPHTPPRQPPVHLRIGIQSEIHTSPLLLVQHHLENLTAVFPRASAFADDLDRVDEVGQDGVVYGGEGAGTRTLLGLRGTGTIGPFGTGKDAAGGEDEDVAVREFLFKFAG